MSDIDKKKEDLDKLLWFVPIKKLRHLLREVVHNIFDIKNILEQNRILNNEINDLRREIRYINKELNKNLIFFKTTNVYPHNYNHNIYFLIIKNILKKYNIDIVYSDYKPDIELFSVEGDRKLIELSNAKIKIFETGEPVLNGFLKGYEDNCLSFTDLSIGFNHLNNLSYVRFPLYFFYMFEAANLLSDINFHIKEDNILLKPNKDNILKRINYINNIKYNKTKFAAFINKWDPSKTRLPIYNAVSKIDNINCPGLFMHNDDALRNEYNDDKLEYLKQFKFNICPENCVEDGYITEKMIHSFMTGCIPIWNGDKNIEGDVINKNAVLYWENYSDNKELLAEIKKLHNDDNLYDKFISQKRFNEDAAVDYIYNQILILHTKIEEIIKSKL